MGRLENKVAIITGAGQGMGAAMARKYHAEGAKVCVVDMREDTGMAVAKEIGMDNGDAMFLKIDVTKQDELKYMIEETVRRFGKLDILCNHVGFFIPNPVENVSEEEFQKIIDINYKCSFFATKYAIPYLKETHGNVIFTASASAVRGLPDSATYIPAKSAVIALAKCVARDYAKYGIRANCIAPGYTDTPLLKSSPVYDTVVNKCPMGRLAQAEDIANGSAFLASDEASYITGFTLVIDGGVGLDY